MHESTLVDESVQQHTAELEQSGGTSFLFPSGERRDSRRSRSRGREEKRHEKREKRCTHRFNCAPKKLRSGTMKAHIGTLADY